MAKAPAIVLSSGGLHSLVAAGVAAREYRIAMVHLKDGRASHAQAQAAFEKQAAHLKPLKAWTLDGAYLAPMKLPPETTGLTTSTSSDAHAALIPLRELHLLTIAASFARQLKASTIFWGVQYDSKNNDALARNIELVQLFNQTLELFPGDPITVRTPLMGLEDQQVIELGYQMGMPFAATWTCQLPNDRPCMSCPACARRIRAFRAAQLTDPLVTPR